jgi:hypothetical protein
MGAMVKREIWLKKAKQSESSTQGTEMTTKGRLAPSSSDKMAFVYGSSIKC